MSTPDQPEIDQRLSHDNLEEWLRLWDVEQGPAKRPSLALMAAVVPEVRGRPLRVLDLCCGPGDAGRAIHARFPGAEVDGVDRDLFLSSLCRAVNARQGVKGRILRRDLYQPDWRDGLEGPYDVVIVGNALHWIRMARVRALLADVRGLLRPGGVFVFMEPVSAEPALAVGYGAWRATQPPQHQQQDWLNFWSRVNAFLGYDHIAQMGARDDQRIDDELSTLGWVELVQTAGFASVDVLLRDPEKVIIAALEP
jgi:SAM-dependent methyltransferase